MGTVVKRPCWSDTTQEGKPSCRASTQSSACAACNTRNETSGLLLSSSSVVLGLCGPRGSPLGSGPLCCAFGRQLSQPCRLMGWTGPGPGKPPPGHHIECPPQNGRETSPKVQGVVGGSTFQHINTSKLYSKCTFEEFPWKFLIMLFSHRCWVVLKKRALSKAWI